MMAPLWSVPSSFSPRDLTQPTSHYFPFFFFFFFSLSYFLLFANIPHTTQTFHHQHIWRNYGPICITYVWGTVTVDRDPTGLFVFGTWYLQTPYLTLLPTRSILYTCSFFLYLLCRLLTSLSSSQIYTCRDH
ncbi:hypothetical protein DM02DRAFT_196807 [Periconia macrospinosa]|uniref:Uncharacterized protein n=1 Tax=Periconia macrospinosa TaxID=97972 RepID=A0A2V1D890_9PLEO|nr:hypothetical protein DM02DRAFT_196807 [Periconia macrospinosa]